MLLYDLRGRSPISAKYPLCIYDLTSWDGSIGIYCWLECSVMTASNFATSFPIRSIMSPLGLTFFPALLTLQVVYLTTAYPCNGTMSEWSTLPKLPQARQEHSVRSIAWSSIYNWRHCEQHFALSPQIHPWTPRHCFPLWPRQAPCSTSTYLRTAGTMQLLSLSTSTMETLLLYAGSYICLGACLART